MANLFHLSAQEQHSLAVFVAVALAAASAAAALALSGAAGVYEPYLGEVNPIAALLAASLIGVLSFRSLQYFGWFDARRSDGLAGITAAAAYATLLAAPVIAVDARFGIDVANVPAPQALLFYPSIALLVDVVFHLAPLALLVAALRSFMSADRAAFAALICVSALEPCYQVQAALSDQVLSALEACIWVQVWAVNLAQVYLFRRFGFGSLYATRLVYYFWWHVVWAAFR